MSNEHAPIVARFRGRLGAFALDAAFEAPMQGVTALFGPSGCGKTTVLRCVAGLQTLRDGYLSVGGEVWQDGADFRPPHERSVGYVFQEASLFAHLSVRRNLLYGHRRAVRHGGPRRRSGSTTSWRCSGWRVCSIGRRCASRAASASGSRSAARCSRSPGCC